MVFSSGDHHDYNLNCQTQNDSLDHNQAYVTANSTSAMMTNMNDGNAIMNGSGAVNTNFQQYIKSKFLHMQVAGTPSVKFQGIENFPK
ncbi:hypothetical protein RDI58_000753 [Solanum bulbocastanum]|uniref:Uncharacterized protein n=1 Tax=Solanum bulbocastanum TaxID=147425 RepID=A0AAN8U3Q6_SOLBU